jgi:hypothetical protein
MKMTLDKLNEHIEHFELCWLWLAALASSVPPQNCRKSMQPHQLVAAGENDSVCIIC